MVGPPESMREHVVAASKAMKKGDWRQCRDYILAVKVKLLLKIKQLSYSKCKWKDMSNFTILIERINNDCVLNE